MNYTSDSGPLKLEFEEGAAADASPPNPSHHTSPQRSCECDGEEFLKWLANHPRNAWNSGAAERHSRLRHRRNHQFLTSLVALFMIAASFRLGQELPPQTIGFALEQLIPNNLLPEGYYPQPAPRSSSTASESPANKRDAEPCLMRLAPKSCSKCGQTLWPLIKAGETCPYCKAIWD
jgi:hypothetical protein